MRGWGSVGLPTAAVVSIFSGVGGGGEAEGEACELLLVVGLRPGVEVDFFLPWSWGRVVRMMKRMKMTEIMEMPKARMDRPWGEVKRSSMVSSPPSSVWLASDALRGVDSVARGMLGLRAPAGFRFRFVRLEEGGVLGWGEGGAELGVEV